MKGVRGEQVEPKPYERSKKFLHITMDARRGRQNWSGPLLYPLIPPLPVALDVTSADQEWDSKPSQKMFKEMSKLQHTLKLWTRLSDNATTTSTLRY